MKMSRMARPPFVVFAMLSLLSSIQAQIIYKKFVNLGMVTTLDNSPIGLLSGQPAALAFSSAIKEINGRNDLLENTGLNTFINNSKSDQATTVAALLYQKKVNKISAFVAESESDLSYAAQMVAKMYNMPQMSWASTDMVFNSYSWFFRTIGSIDPQCVVLARFLHAVGWRRIGFFAGTQPLDIQAAGALTRESTALGMQVISTQVFQEGQTDIDFQVQAMVTARAHIIGLLGSPAEMYPVIRGCIRAGLTGPLYQYFSFWSLMDASVWTNTDGSIMKDVYEFMQNIVGILPFVETEAQQYLTFSATYLSYGFDPRFPAVNNTRPNLRAALAFDAAYVVAIGLDEVMETQNLTSADFPDEPLGKSRLFRAISKVNFSGATGIVAFDSDGNRICRYSFVQMQDGKFVQIGTTDTDLSPSFISKDKVSRGMRFPGGVPIPDEDARIELTIGLAIFIAAIAICVGGIAFVGFLLFSMKRNLEKPIVRAASVPFSIMFLIGCIIGFLSLITTTMDKGNTGQGGWAFSCGAHLWFLSFSWTVIMTALIAKIWRVGRIFSVPGINNVRLEDVQLLKAAGLLFFVELIINVAWLAVSPLKPVWTSIGPVSYSPVCSASNMWPIAIVSLAYKGGLALYVLRLVYTIREFAEGKTDAATVATMSILAAITIAFAMVLPDVVVSHVVAVLGITIGLFAIIFIQFGNFFNLVVFEPHNLDVIQSIEMQRLAVSA